MNKKLIALALVLLIAVGGLFAATRSESVKATLKGTIGPTFLHGILENNVYKDTITLINAFSQTNSFTYGFETNAPAYVIKMSVSDFEQSGQGATGVVKIKTVTASGLTLGEYTNNAYTLFSASSNTWTKDSTTIGIVPAGSEDANGTDHAGNAIASNEVYGQAPNGDYVAVVAFSVSAP